MKRLSELAIGQKAEIISFEKDEIFIKLMEMGCVPGEIIKVEQKAPLGDPISISDYLNQISSGLFIAKSLQPASAWLHGHEH